MKQKVIVNGKMGIQPAFHFKIDPRTAPGDLLPMPKLLENLERIAVTK
jgi:hypothetical protein